MGITTTVDHARQRVLARAEGSIAVGDIRAHLEEERLAAGLSYVELIDGRGCSVIVSPKDVRTIVDILRRLGQTTRLGPTAVIVDTDVGYGMLRMLGMVIEDVCAIQPFHRQEEAEQWLAEFGGAQVP
jgi:hypothetical protein